MSETKRVKLLVSVTIPKAGGAKTIYPVGCNLVDAALADEWLAAEKAVPDDVVDPQAYLDAKHAAAEAAKKAAEETVLESAPTSYEEP